MNANNRRARYAAMILAIALAGWSVGRALAEEKTGVIEGISVRAWTDILSFRCDPLCGDGAWGLASSGAVIPQIEAHTQGANNHMIGWHFVDSADTSRTNTDLAATRWTMAGGVLDGSRICVLANCYVVTQSVWWINGNPHFDYTSSDGNHSAESCFVTAGC